MGLFFVTFGFFLFMALALALGMLLGGNPIKGSCGGLSTIPGLEDACGVCAKKKCPRKQKRARQDAILKP